ncbi:hypothetical protein Bca4012_018195 [Brassica carinata]
MDKRNPQWYKSGTGFPLGRPKGGYGGGGERVPSRLESELRFSGGGSSSRQEYNSEVEVPLAAINGAASTSMSFGNDHNNWDNSSSHISFTIDEPGKRSKTTDFFTLETQFSMPQTSLDMESLVNIPEDSVPWKVRAKRGCATHPRSIAERQTSYADMLDLAVEHIKGLQHHIESLEKGMERCNCGACKK